LHEFAADRSNLLGQSSGEHHDLLLMGSLHEDLLNVSAHVELFEHLIAFVEYEVLHIAKIHIIRANAESLHTSRSTDDDMRSLIGLEHLSVLSNGSTSVEDFASHVFHVGGESVVLSLDLEGQFAGVAENDDTDLVL